MSGDILSWQTHIRQYILPMKLRPSRQQFTVSPLVYHRSMYFNVWFRFFKYLVQIYNRSIIFFVNFSSTGNEYQLLSIYYLFDVQILFVFLKPFYYYYIIIPQNLRLLRNNKKIICLLMIRIWNTKKKLKMCLFNF